ncbi:MAG: hypothetical protein HUJ88_02130 [Fusobacterium necrophorum]|nr:hypothetical protein [Fusobacterium necrophorum]MCI7343435.1 hypothetical protein [Fusobacterium necrophorum]
MEYNTLENWTLERTVSYVLETSYKYKDSTKDFMNFFRSLENEKRVRLREKDERFILLFLKFCRAIQYHSNRDYTFALDCMKNIFLEAKSSNRIVKEIKLLLNDIKKLPSYIDDGRYRVIYHEIQMLVNEYEKYEYKIGDEKDIVSTKMNDDDYFSEYLKEYFAEENLVEIYAHSYRVYFLHFSKDSYVAIVVTETEDDNYISVSLELDGRDTYAIFLKMTEFISTDKFRELYENLKRYYFIPCKAEEYEKKYLNS